MTHIHLLLPCGASSGPGAVRRNEAVTLRSAAPEPWSLGSVRGGGGGRSYQRRVQVSPQMMSPYGNNAQFC